MIFGQFLFLSRTPRLPHDLGDPTSKASRRVGYSKGKRKEGHLRDADWLEVGVGGATADVGQGDSV